MLFFCSSAAIFGAVAFYMKHLGVKTRAADSKKSRGFFRRPLVGKVRPLRHLPSGPEPPHLTQQQRWRSEITSRYFGGTFDLSLKPNCFCLYVFLKNDCYGLFLRSLLNFGFVSDSLPPSRTRKKTIPIQIGRAHV